MVVENILSGLSSVLYDLPKKAVALYMITIHDPCTKDNNWRSANGFSANVPNFNDDMAMYEHTKQDMIEYVSGPISGDGMLKVLQDKSYLEKCGVDLEKLSRLYGEDLPEFTEEAKKQLKVAEQIYLDEYQKYEKTVDATGAQKLSFEEAFGFKKPDPSSSLFDIDLNKVDNSAYAQENGHANGNIDEIYECSTREIDSANYQTAVEKANAKAEFGMLDSNMEQNFREMNDPAKCLTEKHEVTNLDEINYFSDKAIEVFVDHPRTVEKHLPDVIGHAETPEFGNMFSYAIASLKSYIPQTADKVQEEATNTSSGLGDAGILMALGIGGAVIGARYAIGKFNANRFTKKLFVEE